MPSAWAREQARRRRPASPRAPGGSRVPDLETLELKLDLLIALQRVAVREALSRERRAIEEDPVSAAILRGADDWVAAGRLKEQIVKSTKQSEPTVKRRLGELV